MKLMLSAFSIFMMFFSALAFSDESKQVVERDFNLLMKNGMKTALTQLGESRQVPPFMLLVKQDGELGVVYVPQGEEAKNVSVDRQIFKLRDMAVQTAKAGEARAILICFYSSLAVDEVQHQGLMFEMEHAQKVGMLRFLPITENEETENLVVHTKKMVTENKPLVMFK